MFAPRFLHHILSLALLGPLSLSASAQGSATGQALQERFLQQKQERQDAGYRAILDSRSPAMRALLEQPGVLFTHLDSRGHPVFLSVENERAARTISTFNLWPGGTSGLDLDGGGIDFLGVWDSGSVLATHQEFGGRVTVHDPVATGDHATHVAGTMVAAGVNANAKGMAIAAHLQDWDWGDDLLDMSQAAGNGLLISNHSYGGITGWYQLGSTWYWYGDPGISEFEDFEFGFYGEKSRDLDLIAATYPEYLIVWAAGNDRNDAGPGAPGTHFVWDGTQWVSSTTPRSRDGGTTGYDCVGSDQCAKNILTVGAVNDIYQGYDVPEDVQVTNFSNWGPTDDGRIKPDLVANGQALTSSVNTSNSSYVAKSGTSMAAPSVSGSAALLEKLYQDRLGYTPRSATLKGLLIHTADEAGYYDGPDYTYGWGLMNARKAAEKIVIQTQENWHIQERQLSNGETTELYFHADALEPVRITICWTDPAGPLLAPSLDPTDAMLVHDLDLRVYSSFGSEGLPWCLDPSDPDAMAYRGDNTRDNVESMDIHFGADEDFTLRISHKGTIATQSYSLFVTGAVPDSCFDARPSAPVIQMQVVEPDVLLTWPAVDVSVDGCPVVDVMYDIQKSSGDNPAFVFHDSTASTSYLDAGAAADFGSTRYRVIARTPAQPTDYLPGMVNVPPGEFRAGQQGTNGIERWVVLTNDYQLSRTEITNEQYLAALNWAYENGLVTIVGDYVQQYGVNLIRLQESGVDHYEIRFDETQQEFVLHAGTWGASSPSTVSGPGFAYPAGYDPASHPVIHVTWYGAACYCDWLSQMTGLEPYYMGRWDQIPGVLNPYQTTAYRLPTEAEWEFAGQYNDDRTYPWGSAYGPSCDLANVGIDNQADHCVGWTTRVGLLPQGESALGFQDLCGNVQEWTNDWFSNQLMYLAGTNPVGFTGQGNLRVHHGGTWGSDSPGCKLASRGYLVPDTETWNLGFRICRIPFPD